MLQQHQQIAATIQREIQDRELANVVPAHRRYVPEYARQPDKAYTAVVPALSPNAAVEFPDVHGLRRERDPPSPAQIRPGGFVLEYEIETLLGRVRCSGQILHACACEAQHVLQSARVGDQPAQESA